MDINRIHDVSLLSCGLIRGPVDPTAAELVIERYDQWTNRSDSALFPTACATVDATSVVPATTTP